MNNLPKKEIEPIAHIHTPYKDKFGIPRQSGMVDNIVSEIVFKKKYRSLDAVRGLKEFSHIWVLWEFTGFNSDKWSPTVRPPKLGGNKRMGVFATRSPNRPNSIGLSSLKLIEIDTSSTVAPVLKVCGADMLDGTAIYDVKPYIPFTDSHPDASSGFAGEHINNYLNVQMKKEFQEKFDEEQIKAVIKLLSLDPRPSYQDDSERIYGVTLFGYNVKFRVIEKDLIVTDIEQD